MLTARGPLVSFSMVLNTTTGNAEAAISQELRYSTEFIQQGRRAAAIQAEVLASPQISEMDVEAGIKNGLLLPTMTICSPAFLRVIILLRFIRSSILHAAEPNMPITEAITIKPHSLCWQ